MQRMQGRKARLDCSLPVIAGPFGLAKIFLTLSSESLSGTFFYLTTCRFRIVLDVRPPGLLQDNVARREIWCLNASRHNLLRDIVDTMLEGKSLGKGTQCQILNHQSAAR